MEKNNNNAVEKVEKVANKTEKKQPQKKKSTAKKATANKTDKKRVAKAHEKEQKRQQKLVKKQERIALKEKVKAQKEKELAEKRVELARIKAHKKAEKQKAKATAIRAKNKKKAELAAKKAQLKAERKAKKEMLKHESKKDRRARIAEEKAAARNARLERKRLKQEKRQQAFLEKRNAREQKHAYKERRKERNKGVGGWIAAVVSLGVATLVLSSVLTFTFLMPSTSDNMLESGYRKSFYDTVEQVSNIDVNLSKVLASSDSGAIQKYLMDTAINSEIAENDLQQLPLHDESKYYTTKLINQIGDYSKYLCNKLIDGEKLSEQDLAGLSQLYQANLTLKDALGQMTSKMRSDYSFSSMMGGGSGNLVIHGFNELQNLSVQFPELIYDGPFSDGLDQREIKGLKGEEIDDNAAREIFTKIFSEYGLEKIENTGVAGGTIEVYNVQAQKDGQMLFAQISKKGGELIMFSFAGSCEQVKYEQADAILAGENFLQKLDIHDMKAVWINLANNVYTINFASTANGAIVYPDLIKVRVCAETNTVIGIEARTYYTNHTDRLIGSPAISEKQAREKVSSNIEIDSARLAIVPIGQKSEKLCYEFAGEFEGSTYYVYIDAISGRQVEMFKVVQNESEGQLLV